MSIFSLINQFKILNQYILYSNNNNNNNNNYNSNIVNGKYRRQISAVPTHSCYIITILITILVEKRIAYVYIN